MKKLFVILFMFVPMLCMAQTDLSTTITVVSGYWSSVLVIGIGILLFVVGRKVVMQIDGRDFMGHDIRDDNYMMDDEFNDLLCEYGLTEDTDGNIWEDGDSYDE